MKTPIEETPDTDLASTQNITYEGRESRTVLPVLCNALGAALLIVAILLSVPFALPLLFGYQTFESTDRSMAPEIPVGSLVYVQALDPADLDAGDIIVYESGAVVVHRVVSNHVSANELIAKGDIDNVEDGTPVPYSAVVGRVVAYFPVIGLFTTVFESVVGKVYLLLTAICGVMLIVLGGRLRKRNREREFASRHAHELGDVGAGALKARRRNRASDVALKAAVVVLAVVFLGSIGVIGYVNWQYGVGDALYGAASDAFTTEHEKPEGILVSAGQKPPISVDFEALQAENPDVVGWIYCEGTPIDYPVLQGRDDDYYMTHDYVGGQSLNGAIFVDSEHHSGFEDAKSVIYGCQTGTGSMFTSLADWETPGFYDEHPILWLLTPENSYRVELLGGNRLSAQSGMYRIISEPGDELNAFIDEIREESDFSTSVETSSQARYVVLSTRARLFDGERTVLYGMLVPVDG